MEEAKAMMEEEMMLELARRKEQALNEAKQQEVGDQFRSLGEGVGVVFYRIVGF